VSRINSNPLLLWSVLTFIVYWVAGAVVPDPYLSSAMSLLLLIFGGVTFLRFAPDAWQILIHRRRNEAAQDGDGSHLAAYGVTLLSAGSCYVGLFGLLWVYFGQPGDWLGTVYSGFGRGMMGAGFGLLFFSPDVSQRGLRLPSGLLLLGIVSVAMTVVFLLGVHFGQKETMSGWRGMEGRPIAEDRPVCAPDRPVWGAGTAGVYHTPRSPYRQLVVPSRCFKTEREARMAGFRPPR